MPAAKKTPEPAEDPYVAAITEEFVDEEVWAYEPAGPGLVMRMVAEVAGTFILVLLGVGAALFAQLGGDGRLAVGFAFGVGVIIAATIFGRTSGAHLNPAVTLGVWISGRFPGRDVAPYIIAQVIGGALATSALFVFVNANTGYAAAITGDPAATAKSVLSTASNGFAEHSPTAFPDAGVAGFGIGTALVLEALATALLVAVVLGATSVKAPKGIAPFSIGLALTVLVMFTIPFTNAALNPARAISTAIYADPWALKQLWVFLLAPLVGAAIVGLLYRAFSSDDEFEVVEVVETIKD